ncbi:HAD family hydrolase [Selenomonas sp. TAMA-11512]|uniref:Cof-type HAD-IIB family hydrolase n=1 Tax=Selenomonas sp. TAMA-11512 TaxID=3095337 RepID=UPI003089EFCD|nr:HAD family hydrolase [Selenomonas sp. TAMA-11512]
MLKLIASDLDGTLLQHGVQTLSEEILHMISACRRHNVHFAAASGRSYDNIRYVFDSVRDDISYICDNGSVCMHGGKVIACEPIAADMIASILEELKSFPGCDILISCDAGTVSDSKNEDFYQFMWDTSYRNMKRVENIDAYIGAVYKLALFSRDDALLQRAEEHFQKFCGARLHALRTDEVWVDFINPKATKGKALEKLAAYLGVQANACVAFGDRFNDLEMLQFAGTSYVMRTGAEGLSAYTTGVADTVEEVLAVLLKKEGYM